DPLLYCPHSLSLFFNAPAPPPIHPLSLHDALPISRATSSVACAWSVARFRSSPGSASPRSPAARAAAGGSSAIRIRWGASNGPRSEEHTSELQSPYDLVCRLLLEKKKKTIHYASIL